MLSKPPRLHPAWAVGTAPAKRQPGKHARRSNLRARTHAHVAQTSSGTGGEVPPVGLPHPSPALAQLAEIPNASPTWGTPTPLSKPTSRVLSPLKPFPPSPPSPLLCPSCRRVPEQTFSTWEICIYLFVHIQSLHIRSFLPWRWGPSLKCYPSPALGTWESLISKFWVK